MEDSVHGFYLTVCSLISSRRSPNTDVPFLIAAQMGSGQITNTNHRRPVRISYHFELIESIHLDSNMACSTRPEKKLKRSLLRAEQDPKRRPYVSLLSPYIDPSPETIPGHFPASLASRTGTKNNIVAVVGGAVLRRVTEGETRQSMEDDDEPAVERGRLARITTLG